MWEQKPIVFEHQGSKMHLIVSSKFFLARLCGWRLVTRLDSRCGVLSGWTVGTVWTCCSQSVFLLCPMFVTVQTQTQQSVGSLINNTQFCLWGWDGSLVSSCCISSAWCCGWWPEGKWWPGPRTAHTGRNPSQDTARRHHCSSLELPRAQPEHTTTSRHVNGTRDFTVPSSCWSWKGRTSAFTIKNL